MATQRVTIAIHAGASSPSPVPASFVDALDRVVVRQMSGGASTFQLVLNADLPKRLASEIPIVGAGTVSPGNRVKIALSIGTKQQTLIDGIVVHQELAYDAASGTFTYSVIGEDLSLLMRLEEKSTEWPARSCAQIVREIVQSYASRGLQATIVTPQSDYAPTENQWLYRQNATDLDYIRALGRPFGHLFSVRPGASIGADAVGYWGPPARDGTALPALSVAMGAWTNVLSMEFDYDASSSVGFKGGSRTDAEAPETLAVASTQTFGLTSFAKNSSTASTLRRTMRYVEPNTIGALATAYADAIVQETTRAALRVRASIDGLVYGTVVTPASQIPVRGVGDSHDGLYYVEQVEHRVARGDYKQELVLSREGLGKTISQVS